MLDLLEVGLEQSGVVEIEGAADLAVHLIDAVEKRLGFEALALYVLDTWQIVVVETTLKERKNRYKLGR